MDVLGGGLAAAGAEGTAGGAEGAGVEAESCLIGGGAASGERRLEAARG